MTPKLVILGAKRTAFGTYGGALKDVAPLELALTASRAALAQSKLEANDIGHVIYGQVLYSTANTIYIPRHVGLKLGIPQAVPALGINRLCGTGFQGVVEAYHQMLAGDTEAALVGGVESMSQAPYLTRGLRFGLRMGHHEVTDLMTECLTDQYTGTPMAITAENLAEQYKISRDEVDRFALASQMKCKEARAAGRFVDEIAPHEMVDRKGAKTLFSDDEHPRGETTLEGLAKLKPLFKKDGIVTAGTASGIVDGAASLIVATETFAEKKGLKPLARMVAYGISGCDPKIMGIGPVPAVKQALARAKMTIDQIDVIELNEAFAAQALAVQKELGLPTEKLNVNGGAIAIGHPLAASGTRLMAHLVYELKRRKARFGLGTACIGGGQGIAIIVESI